VVSSVDPLALPSYCWSHSRLRRQSVKSSEARRSGGWDLSWFLLLERWAGEGGRQAGSGSGDDASRQMA
jgi:hypothetical protein